MDLKISNYNKIVAYPKQSLINLKNKFKALKQSEVRLFNELETNKIELDCYKKRYDKINQAKTVE